MQKNIPLFILLIVFVSSCHKKDNTVMNLIPKDGDGNVYDTVRIGNQVWMKTNLMSTKYNDGTPIPLESDDSVWKTLTTGAYAYYNDDSTNDAVYGKLYNWYAVNTGKLAPAGWHVPTDDEWTAMMNYLGGDTAANNKIREAGTGHWAAPNTGATNSSGFTSLPGGNHNQGDGPPFAGLHNYTGYWSSTEKSATNAWMRNVQATHIAIDRDDYNKGFGFSVRCIRNQ